MKQPSPISIWQAKSSWKGGRMVEEAESIPFDPIEALAHDGIEGRDGVCFPAEVHGPLYFIPCGPFIVFIGLHIDGFAVSKSCEDIFFHAFISLFSTMTKYWSRMDIFHVPSSLTRVST